MSLIGAAATAPTTALMVGFTAIVGLTFRRSYQAIDLVVGAVETTTVEFVEAVGHEGVKVVPVFIAAAVTMVLLLL